MRTYLTVPYDDRHIVKLMGAKWDIAKKRWYIQDVENIERFMIYMPQYAKEFNAWKGNKNNKGKPSNKSSGFITGENYVPSTCNCIPWVGCHVCNPDADIVIQSLDAMI